MLIARHVLCTILKTVEVPKGNNSEHYRILAPCANFRSVHQALHWVPIPMPTHAYGVWVGMDEHGCDIIVDIIGNITVFEYMGVI